MSGSGVYEGKGDTHFRKTWNKDEYAKKAALREAGMLNITDASQIADISEPVDIHKMINVQVKVQAVDESGFHCRACGVNFKDNLSYIDHLNSPEHLEKIGQDIKVKRATVEQVRLRLLKKKTIQVKLDPRERMELRLKKEALEKQMKKQDKKNKKIQQEMAFHQDHVAAMMGFGGFSSSKK